MITDGGITTFENVLLNIAGKEAILAQITSICTIVPRTCPYDISSFSVSRRLWFADVDRTAVVEYRQLQGSYSYAQVTASVLTLSSSSLSSLAEVYRTNNIESSLKQADPQRFGSCTVDVPKIINSNDNNLTPNGVSGNSSSTEVSKEQVGLIILSIICFLCCLGYLLKLSLKRPSKVSPGINGTSTELSTILANRANINALELLCKRCYTPFTTDANYCAKCGENRYAIYNNTAPVNQIENIPPSATRPRIGRPLLTDHDIENYDDELYPSSTITTVHRS